MKLERLMAMIMILINRRRVSAKALAEYFEVSERTIYRDIETIDRAGIPIVSYQGMNGGFEIMENYKIDKNVLTPEDIKSIIVALKGVNSLLKDKKVSNILEKMKNLESWRNNPNDGIIDETVIIDYTYWGGENSSQKRKLQLLTKGIEEKNLLSFTYCNADGLRTKRVVEPMTIILKGYTWYLYGYCRIREDFRTFRLSRIKELTLLDEGFEKRKMAAVERSQECLAQQDKTLIEIVLKFRSKGYVMVQDFFDEEQIEQLEDGSLVVRVIYPEDDWVYSMILRFGEYVEVIEPPHLRTIIKEKARKLLAVYQD
ncbi:MAG: YafY family transcriptional regulator [Clostridia bacterium]|nr:YafY family transcriptional regulator [Clostridia bacterium]